MSREQLHAFHARLPQSAFGPRLPAIQVAGVRDLAEARLLDRLGVDLVGFPLRLDVHAPDLSEAQAVEVIRVAGIAGKSVLITYEADPAEVVALCRALGVRLVQLHGQIPPEACRRIKALDPGLGVMKSIVVGRDGGRHEETALGGRAGTQAGARGQGPGSQARLSAMLAEYAPFVDAFLTDTFDPATGASGATGRTHDWSLSRALAQAASSLDRPLMLAGGLNPGNVAAAIRAVRPRGVDAHTGLEDASGRKNPDKVRRFVEEARAAFGGLAD